MNLLQTFGIRKEPPYKNKQFLEWGAKHGCIVCGAVAQLHHCIYKSKGNYCSDALVLPLCVIHHTGAKGIHALGITRFQKLHSININEELWNMLTKYFSEHGLDLRNEVVNFLETSITNLSNQ